MSSQFSFQRSERIKSLEISEIVQLSERAAALRAEGQDIIALTTGEPDFPTPPNVIEAAHAAAMNGQTKYPATAGTPALRAEIARQNGVTPTNVIVSTGAKQVLANAMLATLNTGDEVIMPAPFWTSYADIVALAGGVPVVVSCGMDDDFKITPEKLAQAITPATKWIMLNAPSNPTGAIYSVAEQRDLAMVLTAHPHVQILVDEIYAHLSYETFTSFKDVAPELADRMLIVNGVSKAYAMTGWRIGWGIGPVDMIKALGAVQGQITSGACSISQAAALEAISGDQSVLARQLATLQKRRDTLVSGLNALPGITCKSPDGAFYVFPDLTGAMNAKGYESDADFCAALLNEVGLVIVPGRAFGQPGHARISFAYAETDIAEGLKRLQNFLVS